MIGSYPLQKIVFKGTMGPILLTASSLAFAISIIQIGILLLGKGLLADSLILMAIAFLALPGIFSMVLPIALLVALIANFSRWRKEGIWIALQAAGMKGRKLLYPVITWSATIAIITLICTQILAPYGARISAKLLFTSAANMAVVPGRFVDFGDQTIHVDNTGQFFIFVKDLVIGAESGEIDQDLVLTLNSGQAYSKNIEITFQKASWRIGTIDRRVELVERSHSELKNLISSMKAKGKKATYEELVLLKRWSLPLTCLLLGPLALVLGLRWETKAWHIIVIIIGYWMLLRLGDQLHGQLGPFLAALLPIMGILTLNFVLFFRWREL